MCHYKHLILSKREKLLFFLAKCYSLTRIADKLDRNKSTISRELHRNASKKHYLPVVAEKNTCQRRSRRGHFEADTVVGKKGKACLITLVDRKSRYLLGGKAGQKTADAVNTVIINQLRGQSLHSINPDREKEFSKYAKVTEALDGVKFYFSKPHQPWQREINKNTNGLLREYFPKGKDITGIPDDYIQEKIDKLNLRPRKCLG